LGPFEGDPIGSAAAEVLESGAHFSARPARGPSHGTSRGAGGETPPAPTPYRGRTVSLGRDSGGNGRREPDVGRAPPREGDQAPPPKSTRRSDPVKLDANWKARAAHRPAQPRPRPLVPNLGQVGRQSLARVCILRASTEEWEAGVVGRSGRSSNSSTWPGDCGAPGDDAGGMRGAGGPATTEDSDRPSER
jgi:hypothetical protein